MCIIKKIKVIFVIFGIVILLTGCASMMKTFESEQKKVSFISDPSGARVIHKDSEIGTTPLTIALTKKNVGEKFTFKKIGYADEVYYLRDKVNIFHIASWILVPVFLIGPSIDMLEGADRNLPGKIHIVLHTWSKKEEHLIKEAIYGKDKGARIMAVIALREGIIEEHYKERSISTISQVLKDDQDFEVWHKALSALIKVGNQFPKLIKVFKSANSEKKLLIAYALVEMDHEKLGDVTPDVVATISSDLFRNSGGKTYKEAISSLKTIGKPAIVELTKILNNTKDEQKKAEIVIGLGEFGYNAKEAIPEIIESFPILIVTKTYNEGGYSMEGGDYRVNREIIDINHPIAKNKIQILKSKYGKYIEINDNDVSGVVSYYSFSGGSDRVIDMSISYKIYAGAYALNKIAGEDLKTKIEWQQWWEKKKEKF